MKQPQLESLSSDLINKKSEKVKTAEFVPKGNHNKVTRTVNAQLEEKIKDTIESSGDQQSLQPGFSPLNS